MWTVTSGTSASWPSQSAWLSKGSGGTHFGGGGNKASLIQPGFGKKQVPIGRSPWSCRLDARRHGAQEKQPALHVELDRHHA